MRVLKAALIGFGVIVAWVAAFAAGKRGWSLPWYWLSLIVGLLLPWVTMYRDLRDEFDFRFMWGLRLYLGISAVTVSAVLALTFLLSFVRPYWLPYITQHIP